MVLSASALDVAFEANAEQLRRVGRPWSRCLLARLFECWSGDGAPIRAPELDPRVQSGEVFTRFHASAGDAEPAQRLAWRAIFLSVSVPRRKKRRQGWHI